jgi:hypothetical protein
VTVERFESDDHGYEGWLIRNRATGYVLNTTKSPSAGYLWLHFANCNRINKLGGGPWTTTGYIKVCATNVAALEEWAQVEVGSSELHRCEFCWA